ncbi:nuclear transport factor 2 family protein [Flagellimonas lutimaris]|uniref:nuclear transport factor 2 family protein n=1 Tax=Flagellimonas lutimaris TaxID=475082 RepID=UPI003F5CEC96
MEQKQVIINAVTKFIKGGDESDIKALKHILHDQFRNVQYGFFGKKGVFVISKSEYIDLIEQKTFGGVPRSMDILQIEVLGNIAMTKVKMESTELKFISYISLILDDGEWKVIENFPHVEYKSK